MTSDDGLSSEVIFLFDLKMSSKGRYFAHISIDLYCLRTESAASFFALSLFDCSLSISPPSGVDGIQISFHPVATGRVWPRAALGCFGGRFGLLGGKIGPLPCFGGLQTCMVTIVCYRVWSSNSKSNKPVQCAHNNSGLRHRFIAVDIKHQILCT